MTKLDTRFQRAEDSVGFLLWKAANLMQRLHGACLRDLDITPTQFSLMTSLVYLQSDGDVTASAIVAHTGMDKMMVSDLLKTLIRKGRVVKTPNPDDARSSLVRATAAGKRVTNSAVRTIEAFDSQFFTRAGDVTALHEALLALVDPDTLP